MSAREAACCEPSSCKIIGPKTNGQEEQQRKQKQKQKQKLRSAKSAKYFIINFLALFITKTRNRKQKTKNRKKPKYNLNKFRKISKKTRIDELVGAGV